MPSLSVAIALAPWDEGRVRNVEDAYLPALLGAESVRVVPDNRREGCWPTIRRCWEAGLQEDTTHHLVLSDDLLLSQNFLVGLMACIDQHPADIISLFTTRPSARTTPMRGRHWCVSWDGATGAANLLPTRLVEEFLGWEAISIKPECPHDDVRLVAWALQGPLRRRTYTPVPCLVQHGLFRSVLDDPEVTGLLHSISPGFCEDAAEVDWTKGAEWPDPIGPSAQRLTSRVRHDQLVAAAWRSELTRRFVMAEAKGPTTGAEPSSELGVQVGDRIRSADKVREEAEAEQPAEPAKATSKAK